jgi:uncharacterized protein
MRADEIIRCLGLERLPHEGGYFRETYRSKGVIPGLQRHFSTAIYYLITPAEFSALHQICYDEVFHFYLGDPVEMLQISPQGQLSKIILGSAITKGQQVQALAPGEFWQGSRLVEGGQWALLGTTVAPGFDFKDFKMGERRSLLKQYPQHHEEILRFTREVS